jgi:hypothetical protein
MPAILAGLPNSVFLGLRMHFENKTEQMMDKE